MGAKDIHLSDWMRILIGNVPAGFLIELVFRAAFFYILIIICMRLMGKRMSSQLSRNELASLVALGASIGVPLTAPERGILPGVISCMVIVLGHRLLSYWFSKNERLEKMTQGESRALVANGVVNWHALKNANVSRESLFEQLRSEGIVQLGAVK